MKRLLFILLVVIPFVGFSQTSISGIENQYFEVTSVTNGSNTVTCALAGLSNLQSTDKVILIQMTGAEIEQVSSTWFRNNGILSDVNLVAGRYEYLSVQSVNTSTGEVVFTANLKRTYDATQRVQIVKLIEDEYVNVDGTVTAKPWDGTTGGVVGIVAYKKLTLNADINVDGDGFTGASPTTYSVGCRSFTPDTAYFLTGTIDKAGVKGHGVISDDFAYMVGIGNALNGGGGGDGYFGGGGGGSNYTDGGRGGVQLETCGTFARGYGGIALGNDFYDRINETNPYERYAIAMGGGGGASNEFGADVATDGGNGGGIVIILTDTIAGNSYLITASGDSVTSVATAGGAGGGGGGVVILDATAVSTNLNINIVGGKGGDTETNCTGAGGGGSGGVFWHNGSSILPNTTVDSSGGARGLVETSCSGLLWGGDGSDGIALGNYEPILNGFSFNAITRNDTICQGQSPIELYGSTPKGEAPFTFNWLSSTDNSTWSNISSATSKNYQPPILYETTYYKRVVTNGEGLKDTSIAVEIFVWDSISNNELLLRDTICYGIAPGTLNAREVSGGNNTYTYIWESKTNSTDWTERTIWGSNPTPSESSLTETTYYRRTVNSAKVCTKTSAADTITVLPLIQNNLFQEPDTTICENLDGGTLTPETVSGGDESYTYSWISSTNGIDYSPISGSSSTRAAGNLSQTTYFKRIVYSGNDDACIDTTSMPRTITVLESISGNSISNDSTRYCYGDTPNLISGGTLSGGQSGDYRISWWQNVGSGWTEITGITTDNYQAGEMTDSTVFRRQVISGAFDACIDISNTLDIDIIPAITNNLGSSGENICENQQPVEFSESAASGGAGPGTYEYLWLEMPESSATWTAASTSAGSNTGISYTPTNLTETTIFRRRVLSHICADTSNEINIVVYPEIENNTITGNAIQYTCYNSEKNLIGSTPTGGQPASTYNYYWESSSDQVVWSAATGSPNSISYSTEALVLEEYFRRIVTSGELEQCQDISVPVQVRINDLPTGDIVSKIDTLCSGSDISISYNASGNGPFTFELGETGVIHTETGLQNTSGQIVFALNQSADIAVINVIDDSLCYADLSGNTGLIEATVYEVPVANAGEDFEACGLTTQLNATASVGDGKWTTSTATFTDDASANTQVDVTGYGLETFTWTETNWRECTDQDEVTVEFFEQPIDINAGEDISLKYEFVTQLNADATSVGEGYWQFTEGYGEFDDSTLYNTQITLPGIGEYNLRWTIINGVCNPIFDDILLSVLDLELFGGFSPNEDGINDTYTVDLFEGSRGVFIIIDRNGNLVREIEGVSIIEWDGTSNGADQVPSGTYFYILKEEGRPNRTGYIELRR